MDIVDPDTRSRMMSGIRSTNTKPEIYIRSLLHRKGFRFKLHDSKLPGKPDIVLPKYRAIILVHGCFWHGHSCPLFKMPSTRQEFWKHKIENNRSNDDRVMLALSSLNWRIATVWECAIKGPARQDQNTIIDCLVEWLLGQGRILEIPKGIRG